MPGLGHPVHKKQDPRTPVLIRIAEEEGLRGPHLRLFEAIGRVHPQVLNKTLPLNGAGVCGAALADLGLPVDLLRGFALLARAAGLWVMVYEWRAQIYLRTSPEGLNWTRSRRVPGGHRRTQ